MQLLRVYDRELVHFEFIEHSMKNILIINDLELKKSLYENNTSPIKPGRGKHGEFEKTSLYSYII